MHFTRYYLLKDSISFIDNKIKYDQDTSNTNIFKYAMFYDIGKYYKFLNPFKKDKYNLSKKIDDNFYSFLEELMNTAYNNSSLEQKLFCYYLLASNIINKYFSDYLKNFNNSFEDNNTLDVYFFNKNEKIKLHQTNIIHYFFDSFDLNESDKELLNNVIKKQFGFFCSEAYFNNCYNSVKFYYNYLSRSKTGIKKIIYFFYDIILNHKKEKLKAKYFLLPKKIDTTILNLNKNEIVLNNNPVNYNITELYDFVLKEIKKGYDALNLYFNQEQNLKLFNKLYKKID